MKAKSCIVLALLGCAGPALAQERRVDVTLSNQLTYDTNALRASGPSQDGTSGGGDDFIISPAANVDILLPVGRQSVFLAGSVGYDFYAKESRLDRERIGLNGGVNLAVGGGCTGLVNADYSRGNINDLTFIDGFDPRNVIQTVGYGGRINCGEGMGLTSGIGYYHSQSENSSLFRKISDYGSDTVDVSIGYSRPALGTIALYGSYTDTTYPNRLLGGFTSLEDGVEVFSIGGRFNRQIGVMLSGSVSAGYTKVKPKLPGVPGFTGPSYSADLTYTPGTRMRFTLGAGRSVDQSNLLNISYAITDSVNLGAQYALSDSLRLLAGVGYVRRKYEESPVETPFPVVNGTKNWQVSGGFSYSTAGPWRLNGDVSYNTRSSENTLFDYNSTRASLTLAYHF